MPEGKCEMSEISNLAVDEMNENREREEKDKKILAKLKLARTEIERALYDIRAVIEVLENKE